MLCAAVAAAPLRANAADLRLEVDVSELPGDNERLERFVYQTVGPELEKAGHRLNDTDPEIVVRVRFRSMEDGERNYGIHFEFVDGETTTPAIEWVDCIFCTHYRLQTKFGDATPKLIAAVEAREAELDATEDPGEADDGDTGDDGPGPVDPPPPIEQPPAKLGALGIVGIVGMGMGIGAGVFGGVELARGEVLRQSDGRIRTGLDHTPPGIALVTTGGVLLVAGAVMLGVDLAQRKKKRRRAASVQITGLGLRF